MAGAFHFMIIGIAAGMIGFEKMILALIDRKKARKLNEKANSIFRVIANKYGVKGAVRRLHRIARQCCIQPWNSWKEGHGQPFRIFAERRSESG